MEQKTDDKAALRAKWIRLMNESLEIMKRGETRSEKTERELFEQNCPGESWEDYMAKYNEADKNAEKDYSAPELAFSDETCQDLHKTVWCIQESCA